MNIHEQHIVRIEDWTNQGRGVSHVGDLVVFVEGALPGDRARIEISELKKNYALASCLEILEASPDRRESPCLYADRCDGCPLIELDYSAQLDWKKSFIESAFLRIGKQSVQVDMLSDEDLGYRNKVNMRLDDRGRLSYSRLRSNEMVAVDSCPVATEPIRRLIGRWNSATSPILDQTDLTDRIRMVVIRANPRGETMIILVLSPCGAPLRQKIFSACAGLGADVLCACENKRPGDVRIHEPLYYSTAKKTLDERILDLHFSLSPQSFFQVNRFTIEPLYQAALSLFSDRKGSFLDLYCGTGTTSLLLAKEADRVIGVEAVRSAVEDAIKSADYNQVRNVEFICAKAEDVIGSLTRNRDADKALVDPPRKGLDKQVVDALVNSSLRELVYISCNPVTQARDIALLLEGGFRLEKLVGLDQFPHTGHVETIALIQKM